MYYPQTDRERQKCIYLCAVSSYMVIVIKFLQSCPFHK